MTATATWFRSAEIVNRDEAEAFFASRVVAKSYRVEDSRPVRQGSASLSARLVKR